jgi:hypothetical protein
VLNQVDLTHPADAQEAHNAEACEVLTASQRHAACLPHTTGGNTTNYARLGPHRRDASPWAAHSDSRPKSYRLARAIDVPQVRLSEIVQGRRFRHGRYRAAIVTGPWPQRHVLDQHAGARRRRHGGAPEAVQKSLT